MFGDNDDKKKMDADRGKVETILGNGTNIEGDIKTKGSIRIEGEISGNINADGDIFVGEDGRAKAEIKARNVILAGRVEGNISAKKLEVLPSGKLIGDINIDILKIEEGALFEGSSKPSNNKDNNKGNRVKKELASTPKK